MAIFQKVQKVAHFNHEMRALPTRCQRLPLPLLVCVVTLWRGMGHILATHGGSHLAKVSLNVFVYHYPPVSQRAHVFLTPASFPLGWGVKCGILNLFVSGEMATHSTGTNDLFPMSFSTPGTLCT